jgi:hypothetical protein
VGKVDIYKSTARKYKKGKSYQWSIPLYKGHPFQDQDKVAIIKLDDLKDVEGDYNKLRNKYDHLQERLRKELEESSQRDRVISDLSNRGFLDFILGRLPESYKQLNPPKEEG